MTLKTLSIIKVREAPRHLNKIKNQTTCQSIQVNVESMLGCKKSIETFEISDEDRLSMLSEAIVEINEVSEFLEGCKDSLSFDFNEESMMALM